MDREQSNLKTVMTDILEPRRKGSDFLFMSRSWFPVKAYGNGRCLISNDLFLLVQKSERVQEIIDEISEKELISKKTLEAMVDSILKEIGHQRKLAVIRFIGMILLKILKRNYLGLVVAEHSVLHVRDSMGPNPVIFAPTHRSYGDFILLSYLCYHYNIEIPAIAAGIDFQKMFVVGHLLKDCGAFFMRRSFANDKLYRVVFLEYISQLMTNGDSAVEFFIEGTRSRSGKSYPPKFGFLRMALEPFYTGKVPDITVVPISITYDKILEDRLFAIEVLGIPKPKESTIGLLKGLQCLEHYGKVFVQFAEPISVKNYMDDPRRTVPAMPHVGLESHITKSTENVTKTLGYYIIKIQQSNLVITTFNLLATCLATHNLLGQREVPLSRLINDAWILKHVLEALNVCVEMPENPELAVEVSVKTLRLHKLLKQVLTETGEVSIWVTNFMLDEATLTALQQDPEKLKLYSLAFSDIMLQQYVNPCCQRLFNVSLLALVLYMWKNISQEELLEKYHFFRSLFSYDFVYYDKCAKQEFAHALHDAGQLQLCSTINNIVSLSKICDKSEHIISVLLGLLLPFCAGYWAALTALEQLTAADCRMERVEMEVQHVIKDLVQNRMAPYGYILSLDLIRNALHGFKEVGILERFSAAMDWGFDVDKAEEVKTILRQIIVAVDQQLKAIAWTSKEDPVISKL